MTSQHTTAQHTPSRRTVVTGAAALTAAGFVATPSPALAAQGKRHTRLTVLGTTDLHGNVFNWDYFKNLEFDNSMHDDIGIAKAATLIKAVRERLGDQPVVTLDAGDTIQGTPLAYYYARIEPITGGAIAPDGQRDEPRGLRRRRARQPRVQLRHRHAAHLRVAARLPAARRQRGRPRHRPPGLPALHRQAVQGARRPRPHGRRPRPDQPRHRDLGQGQRRGPHGVPRPGRAGLEVRARAEAPRLRRRGDQRPQRRRHLLVVRRRAAVAGERRLAGGRAGPRRRRDPRRPRPQGHRRALRHQRRDRASRSC